MADAAALKAELAQLGATTEAGLQEGGADVGRIVALAALTLGRFAPATSTRLAVTFTHAQATGHARLPVEAAKIPPLWSDVVYLDADFRLNRGSFGSLYVLALEQRKPAGWARDG